MGLTAIILGKAVDKETQVGTNYNLGNKAFTFEPHSGKCT